MSGRQAEKDLPKKPEEVHTKAKPHPARRRSRAVGGTEAVGITKGSK